MRTDPRKAYANEQEAAFWAALHDLVAHPLMVLTWYSRLSLTFHDWTSRRAWPRPLDVARAWAAELGGSLPTRAEAALLYATLRDEFDHSVHHWTDTLASEGMAFTQYFVDGRQDASDTCCLLLARAVRRLPL